LKRDKKSISKECFHPNWLKNSKVNIMHFQGAGSENLLEIPGEPIKNITFRNSRVF
jgi:hypothetical protein